jgi:rSAM/selenodomain-associated transferase 2
MQTLSIILPTLNEGAVVARTLQRLQAFRTWGHEVIVVDGGSFDDTVHVAAPFVDKVIKAARGRARQMNAGAAVARGNVLLFLHADTLLPGSADRAITKALHSKKRRQWGRFDIRLSGRHPLFRMVERAMNLRSRLTGIATGDQAIFVRRDAFERVGGFADIPLMEDVALSRMLRRLSRPACVKKKAVTSSRRWEQQGILRTIIKMWSLRLRFFLGADPARLARHYNLARHYDGKARATTG